MATNNRGYDSEYWERRNLIGGIDDAASRLRQHSGLLTLIGPELLQQQIEALEKQSLELTKNLEEYERQFRLATKKKSSLVLTEDQLKELYPDYERIVTDLGYDCGYPVYLTPGNTSASERIIAYDCKNCGGIILKRPLVVVWDSFRTKLECRFCFDILYDQEDD